MYRRLNTTLLILVFLLAALTVGVTAQDAATDDGGTTAAFLAADPGSVMLQAQTPSTVALSVPMQEGDPMTVTVVMEMDTELAVSLAAPAPAPASAPVDETMEMTETAALTETMTAGETMTDTAEATETMTETADMAEAENMAEEVAGQMDEEMADHVHIQQQVSVYVDVLVPLADGTMLTVTVPLQVDVDLMVNFSQTVTETETKAEPAGEEAVAEEAVVEETAPAEEASGMAEPYITIARSRVNLRGGPGTNFPVVGTAAQGEQFAVVGKNTAGNWFEFQRTDNSTAWIADFIVTLSGDKEEISVSEEIPEPPAAAAPAAPSTSTSTSTSTTGNTGGGTAYTSGVSGKLLYSVANMDVDQWELWEYNFANGASTKISNWRTEVAVSPDNSQIAYFAWPGDVGDQVGIYIMDSNLNNSRLLVYGGAYPSFNPGGDRLVVQGGQDIYVVNSDGEGLRRLTRGEYPAWSPISNEIVHRACVGGGCGLWIIDANSGDPDAKRRLTEGGSDGQPAWSPNGQRIAYISQEDGNFEIYVINDDGSGKTRLTNNPSSDGLPVWSPDGQWIAFRSDRGGSWAIYAVRPDGTGLRKLVDANVLDHWYFEKMAWRR